MYSHFEGDFSEEEKARIEKTARAVDRRLSTGKEITPSWTFVRFERTWDGYPYRGVRRKDGLMVRAKTTEGLVEALEAFCRERLRLRRLTEHADTTEHAGVLSYSD